jgi:hypothetical protein
MGLSPATTARDQEQVNDANSHCRNIMCCGYTVTFGSSDSIAGRSLTEDRPRPIIAVVADVRDYGANNDASPAICPWRQYNRI